MYIGFLTACLPGVPVEEKVEWAKEVGFKSLELACWPFDNSRDFSATDIDVDNFSQDDADRLNALFAENDMHISSLGYYDNNLSNDPEKRAFINAHSFKVIDAAEKLGVDMVGLFVGKNIDVSIEENFDEFEEFFTRICDYAAERNIKIIIENCPMLNWLEPGKPGTISYSPELWDEMFRRVPHANFGLNFDPSHLYHLMIDYIPLVEQYKDRIFHVHAKDAEIFPELLNRYGVPDRQLKDGQNWWRFRMPGMGQVDLRGMVEALEKIGYDGVISIEHEDPVYEGSKEKVYEGLKLGYEHLAEFVK
jgi:sugar phosphate isomerase/epimerase